MNSHQTKGIIISLLFIAVVALLGIDLGRIFWIALVLLFALGGTCYAGLAGIRIIGAKRSQRSKRQNIE